VGDRLALEKVETFMHVAFFRGIGALISIMPMIRPSLETQKILLHG